MRVYEEYDEKNTRNIITTDIDNLDLEVKYLSQAVYDFRMYLAYANYEFAKAEAQLKRWKKEFAATVRICPADYGIGPPDLKTAIEEVVAANEDTVKLEEEVIAKKLVVDKISAAVEALNTKTFNVGQGIKLLLRNYYADNPIPEREKQVFESMDYEKIYDHLASVMANRKKEVSEK